MSQATDHKDMIQQKALSNALNNESMANYQTIFDGFEAMGIDMGDIEPRVNVFTFHAWKALGRVVKKGQHGVKIVTIIPCTKKDAETGEETPVNKVKTTTVFHISQTEAIDGIEGEPVNETAQAPVVVVEAVDEVKPENTVEVDEDAVNAYEERLQAKRERYEARATAARAAGNATYSRARSMASVIPFGQPILVGHHSEKRDRNYRNRIHSTYGNAFALLNKSEHYAKKAAAVGTGGISSDDPAAVKKLREELEQLERNQDRMKAANKAIRHNKTPETKIAALVALGFDETRAAKLLEKDFAGRIGFADYQLTNNNANIKRIRGRIAELEKLRSRADVEKIGEGFTYREDTTENRVMFIFEGKPETAIRDILKAHAFKWSPSRGAWVRQLNANGIWNGEQVFKRLSLLAATENNA